MSVLLSVVVPCFNHAAYLERCVESVLKQITQDVEIIVVDDGSTDGIVEVVNKLPQQVKFLQQANAGPASARNNGLAHVEGRYIAFLDADDVWLPGFASTMVQALETTDKRTVVVTCGWQYVDLDERPIGLAHFGAKTIDWSVLVTQNLFPIHACLCRAEIVRAMGGFDPNIIGVEDWDLWIRLVNAGYAFSTVQQVLVAYRTVPNSVSRNARSMFKNSLKVLDKVFTQLSPPPAVIKNRDKAYAWRYLDACAELYANKEDKEAEEYLGQGVKIWPDLLKDCHTVYTLVCARQPAAYKTTRYYLDLLEAEKRTQSLLLGFQRSFPEQVQEGLCELYDVLAQLARVQQNGVLARKYALQSAQLCPRTMGLNGLKTWGKTWFDRWRRR